MIWTPLFFAVAMSAAETPRTALLPWSQGLDAGLARALAGRKPMLVRIVANGCPWCRKLEGEMGQAEVQKELGRWTLVEVNQDRAPGEADDLGVGPVPALRVLTAGGQLVGSRDGYLGPKELVAFLQQQFPAASAAAKDALVDTSPPDAAAVAELVRHFAERNPTLREAAVRRLLAHPDLAGPAVVKALRDGGLSSRLAAQELLEAWKAPVQSLDPWRPETFSADSLTALEKWLRQAAPKAVAPDKLSDEQLAEARRQLDRMLKASPAEAEAIREQLARFREALVGEVSARLKQAAADEDRRRLLTLRYRLAASDALALGWPGGLIRLAAGDSRQRQSAAEELANRAVADDQPLLLQLFSDPDPMVRENCLRGLQAIGGKESLAALVKLLDDPEPNVRAAVLKQLAQNPSRQLVPQVAAYVAKEQDADLVVHAIRFLVAARGQQAVKCLMSLLAHGQWQVRAEAAESLGKALAHNESLPMDLQADAYVALIGLLDDGDAFVVSRVVQGLAAVESDVAVEPLVRAAGKHPDLMPKIVELLARSEKVRRKALPHLRAFARHKDPGARAAALRGLVEAVPDEIEEELLSGLKDAESKVRAAAAAGLFHFFEQQRTNPEERMARRLSDRLASAADAAPGKKAAAEKPGEKEKKPAQAEPDDASERILKSFYAGEGQPKWMQKAVEPLGKMLSAEFPEERVEAALALAPLGEPGRAMPVLLATASAETRLLGRAKDVLPWLLWDKRLEAFRRFQAMAANESDRAAIVQGMAETPDRRAAELFWQMLAEPRVTAEMAATLEKGLWQAYFGQSGYRSLRNLPEKRRLELVEAAKPRAAQGSEWTRLVALLLLVGTDSGEAARIAAGMADDTRLSEALRNDAFQILLAAQTKRQAGKLALAAMKGDNLERRKRALAYLVDGRNGLRTVRKQFHLTVDLDLEGMTGGEQPGVPQAPPGVTVEQLRPLLADPDPQLAAYAGYLAALLGDAQGLPPLLRYWQQEGEKALGTDRLVYTAIAALDDSRQVPLLRQMAEKLQRHEVRDFYWTIRAMTGPEVLAFRKELRDKVGVENLR